jgi:hypothetical protein
MKIEDTKDAGTWMVGATGKSASFVEFEWVCLARTGEQLRPFRLHQWLDVKDTVGKW